jgi:multidrug efflux pump subunit AcrB
VRLGGIAFVGYGLRERESIGRIDGREAVVLSVEPSGTANLVALSRALRARAAEWEARGIGFDVVLDQGGALEASVRGVLSALLQGLAVVTALLPVFVRRARKVAVLAASLPLTAVLAVAALAAARVSLDSDLLSGLAVGIGTVVDTGIIVSEQKSARAMRSLAPSLGASLATTLVVLAPLLFLEFAAEGIRRVALSIGLLLVISFTLDMLFLPAFFLPRADSRAAAVPRPPGRVRRALKRVSRLCLRGLHALVDLTIRRRRPVLAATALLTAGMAATVFLAGKDFTAPAQDAAVFAHLEFEPGASLESVDARVLDFTRGLAGRQGVLRVQSVARRGSAEMQVRYDPGLADARAVAALLEREGSRIPGGFLYLPDAAGAGGRGIEVAIRGEDDAVLRSLARSAAALLEAAPGIRRVVLNFKDPAPVLAVRVDPAKASRFGVCTSDAAAALRWALHGPVALKWIEGGRETDLRVMESGARAAGRADILALPVRNHEGAVRPLGSFAALEDRAAGGRISRTDRQRTVSLTVHAEGTRIDAAAARIRGALAALALPEGFAVELDREVRDLDDSFRLLWAALGLSAVFVFLVLAGFGESLLAPLAVLSILPASLAFPLAAHVLRGEPLRVPVLVGFILLAGMVVNNSILVIDAIRERLGRDGPSDGSRGRSFNGSRGPLERAGLRGALHLAIRSRIRPLLVTSVATIAGTVPLAFSRVQGAGYLSSLAFVVFWGMLGSLVSTILVVPALAFAAPRLVPPRRIPPLPGRTRP